MTTVGFDQRYAEQIFGLFQRLHGKHEYVGTGYRIIIMQKIMENHDGFITATSEVDKGTTFYCNLQFIQDCKTRKK